MANKWECKQRLHFSYFLCPLFIKLWMRNSTHTQKWPFPIYGKESFIGNMPRVLDSQDCRFYSNSQWGWHISIEWFLISTEIPINHFEIGRGWDFANLQDPLIRKWQFQTPIYKISPIYKIVFITCTTRWHFWDPYLQKMTFLRSLLQQSNIFETPIYKKLHFRDPMYKKMAFSRPQNKIMDFETLICEKYIFETPCYNRRSFPFPIF